MASIFSDAKMAAALIEQLTFHCHVPETRNNCFRSKHNSTTQAHRERKPYPL